MNENPPPDATPDQLLRLLDVEIAKQRGKRNVGARSRLLFRAGGLILIVGAMLAALALLQYFVADLPRPARSEAAAPDAQPALFEKN